MGGSLRYGDSDMGFLGPGESATTGDSVGATRLPPGSPAGFDEPFDRLKLCPEISGAPERQGNPQEAHTKQTARLQQWKHDSGEPTGCFRPRVGRSPRQ